MSSHHQTATTATLDRNHNPPDQKKDTSSSPVSKRPRTDDTAPHNHNRDDWILLSQGAEARVYQVPLSVNEPNEYKIVKERFSKAYRHSILDQRLTKQRSRMEGRLLAKCGAIVNVPRVLQQPTSAAPGLLHLEYLPGITVKDWLWRRETGPHLHNHTTDNDNAEWTLTQLAQEMGRTIGRLHTQAHVVHGDLTTSNFMLVPPRNDNDDINKDGNDITKSSLQQLYLIDFGLAKPLSSSSSSSSSNNNKNAVNNVEDLAVDLYVLERALQSTHPQLPAEFWTTLVQSYATNASGGNAATATLQRLDQVRQRGRKRACFG